MPSTSQKQANFMAMAAHSADAAEKFGIPQSVAQDYFNEDQKAIKQPQMRRKRQNTLSKIYQSGQ